MNVPRRRRLPFRPITPIIYYDNFNRADGTLGANWVWTGNTEVQVVSNRLTDSAPGQDVAS